MAKNKKNTKKKKAKKKNLASDDKKATVLVNVKYTESPKDKSSPQKKRKIKIDRPKNCQFRKVQLDGYKKYKEIEAFLHKNELILSTEDINICLEIGKEAIERAIEELQAQLSESDLHLLPTLIKDLILNQISEAKKWKLLKEEIKLLEEYNSNKMFERGKLILFKTLRILQKKEVETHHIIQIKRAGNLIYKAKGKDGLKHKSIWNLIPASCHQPINLIWRTIANSKYQLTQEDNHREIVVISRNSFSNQLQRAGERITQEAH